MHEESTATACLQMEGANPAEYVSQCFLLCHRNLGLYPQAHPRVAESIDAICAAVARHHERTGEPFAIDAERALNDEAEGHPGADYLRLGQLLQLHWLERVVVHPGVNRAEVLGICGLLETETEAVNYGGESAEGPPLENDAEPENDDSNPTAFATVADAESSCADAEDPANWEHVELCFYHPEDLPDSQTTTSVAILEKAAGVRGNRRVEALMARLPDEAQGAIRRFLSAPQFLRRVSDLRKTLRQRNTSTEDKSENVSQSLDLVGEALESLLRSSASEPRVLTAGAISRTLNEFVGFAEHNVDFLTGTVDSVAAPENTDRLRSEILHSAALATERAAKARTLQGLKKRLSAFFTQAEAIQAATADPNQEECLKPRRADEEQHQGISENGIVFPPSILEVEEEALSAQRNLAPVVFELLVSGFEVADTPAGKTALAKRIVQLACDGSFEQKTLSEAAQHLQGETKEPAEEIVRGLLSRFTNAEALAFAMETIAPHEGSVEIIDDFFGRRGRSNSQLTLKVLSMLQAGSSTAALREVAATHLAKLVQDPALLVLLVREDSRVLDGPLGHQLLKQIPSKVVQSAFREYFTSTDPAQVARFIAHLPSSIPDGEQILFSALDHGSPTVRRAALRHLGKNPTPSVVPILIDVVRLNNIREKPDLEEVRCVLSGLLSSTHPSAREFLHDVKSSRMSFRKVYKRSIRGVLASLIEGKKV